MNELIKEKTMTVKEVANILQCSENTILNAVRDLFPEIIQNGKTTYLTEIQATAIKLKLDKHHNLARTCEVEPTDLEMLLLQKKLDKWKDEKIFKLQEENKILKPKAEYTDNVLLTTDLFSATQISQDLGISAKKLNELLEKKQVIYKSNGQWILKSEYKNNGYVKSKTHLFYDENNNQHSTMHTYWTQLGRKFILQLLKQ